MRKLIRGVPTDPSYQEPPSVDPGLFAMAVTIGITIFAFIFILFVSTVE
jgi:hypothetical protein